LRIDYRPNVLPFVQPTASKSTGADIDRKTRETTTGGSSAAPWNARATTPRTHTQGAPSFSTLIFLDFSMTKKKMKIHDLSAQHIYFKLNDIRLGQ